MKSKIFFALPMIAVLSGCAAPLKPGNDISKYYIIPGTTFVATQLCGIDSGMEACIRMQNGAAVKSVIKTNFRSWVHSLNRSEQIVAQSGKPALVLDQETGNALLNSLITDNKERRRIKMQQRDDRDDR